MLGERGMKKSRSKIDVFLLHFSLLNNLFVKKILQPHLVILRVVIRAIERMLVSEAYCHVRMKVSAFYICRFEGLSATVSRQADIGETG